MDTHDIALDYLKKHPGHYLFPLNRNKGKPCILDNLAQASNDPEQIKKWHAKWPGCWWGLSLKKSGLIAFDFDVGPGKVGMETYRALRDELKAAGDPLVRTLIHESPSGGPHLIYRGAHHFSQGKIGKNCDTPNYVVIPGCTKADGTGYKVKVDAPIAEAPALLIKKVERPKDRPRREYTGKPIPLDIFKRMLADTPYIGGPPGLNDRHSYQGCLDFLMMAHEAACGDEGDYLWSVVEWCLADPNPDWEHSTSAEWVERRWVSIIDDDEGGKRALLTRASWLKILEHFGKHYVAEIEQREGVEAFASDPVPQQESGKRRDRDDVLRLVETLENTTGRTDEETESFKAKARDLVQKHGITEQDRTAYRERAKHDGSGGLDAGLGALLKAWVYIKQHKVWYRRVDQMIFDKEAFDLAYRNVVPGIASLSKHLLGLPNADPWRPRTFDGFCFMPKKGENVAGYFNQWVEPDIKPIRNDDLSRLWYEHIAYLLADEEDRHHLLNWIAWVYHYQHLHPHHALLLRGEIQGTGKSFVSNVSARLLGPINPATDLPFNFYMLNQVSLDELTHNGWAMRTKLAAIEEVRPSFGSMRDSNAVAKHLHALISQDGVPIDEKNLKPFMMGNSMAFLLGSNSKDAIAIDNSDRRYLDLSVDSHRKEPLEPRNNDYYRALYGRNGVGGLINDPAALAAIAYELQHRDLKDYSGAERAPWTQAKSEMLLATSSSVEQWMVENADDPPLSYSLVTIDEVLESVPDDVRKQSREPRQVIADVLKRRFNGENLGKVRLGGRRSVQPRLWAINRPKSAKPYRERFSHGDFAATYWSEHREPTPAEIATMEKAGREAQQDFANDPL